MTLTTHLLSGAVIGTKFSNSILGFAFGFLSHFILDALPHHEYHVGDWGQAKESLAKKNFKGSGVKFSRIFLDGLLGASLILLLCATGKSIFFSSSAGALGGFLPDFLWGLYFLFPAVVPKRYYRFHEFFHWHRNKKIPCWGKIVIESTILISIIVFFLM